MRAGRRRRVGFHPGGIVALVLLALVAGSFAALFVAADERRPLLAIGPYLTRVLAFSLAQAALSTILSLALGAGIALALARRRFPGSGLVLAALGAAAVMPAIVVVFAVLSVYGRSGWLMELARWAGLGVEFRVFGWPGILIAHVFLNASLAARILLDALGSVPAEHWRLAHMLGFGPAHVFRHLDWPILRAELPGLASLIFLLCFTSFAIVLTLGGGPAYATLEVAIFEALRFELDFARAAWLALVQVAICLTLALALHWSVRRLPIGRTLRAPVVRPDGDHRGLKILDALVLAIGACLVLPLVASTLLGAAGLGAILDADLGRATATSLVIAGLSGAVACALALALASAARDERLAWRRTRIAAFYDILPTIVLAVPPFALTAGLFLLLHGWVDPATAGFVLLPLVNALGALAFTYRFVSPALTLAAERYGNLCALLDLRGLQRLKIVDWPLLRRPLGAAFALAAALSFGDFGIVALFGGGALRTLPYLLYERLGAYRLEEASAIGFVLVAVAFGLAYVSFRWSDADRG